MLGQRNGTQDPVLCPFDLDVLEDSTLMFRDSNAFGQFFEMVLQRCIMEGRVGEEGVAAARLDAGREQASEESRLPAPQIVPPATETTLRPFPDPSPCTHAALMASNDASAFATDQHPLNPSGEDSYYRVLCVGNGG